MQIWTVSLNQNNVSDSQVLEDLLHWIHQDKQIDSVYTDGTYDNKATQKEIKDWQEHAKIKRSAQLKKMND